MVLLLICTMLWHQKWNNKKIFQKVYFRLSFSSFEKNVCFFCDSWRNCIFPTIFWLDLCIFNRLLRKFAYLLAKLVVFFMIMWQNNNFSRFFDKIPCVSLPPMIFWWNLHFLVIFLLNFHILHYSFIKFVIFLQYILWRKSCLFPQLWSKWHFFFHSLMEISFSSMILWY